MFKRFFLFMAVNIAVVTTISIVTSLLGLNHYVTAGGLDYNALLGFCLVWGMAGSFISLLISKFMAKMTMGVKVVDVNDPQYAWLVTKVHQMAQGAGISKMPEVGVYESPEVNAFATGATKNSALVAVSTGLLQRMNQDEIEGVLGHEVAHIANGDMVTLALIQGVINAFVMFFARIAAFALQQAMRSDDERESSAGTGWAYHISVFVFEVFFGFLAMFIVSYFSRIREFRADQGGALYAGRGKMINALKRLQSTFEGIDTVPDNVKCMKISSKGSFMKYLSTHPSLEDRIQALQRG